MDLADLPIELLDLAPGRLFGSTWTKELDGVVACDYDGFVDVPDRTARSAQL